MEVKQIGNLWGENTEFDNKTSGRVYDKCGISPALNTMQGGWKQPMIIENVIIGGEQKHQAVKKDGVCTCLTSSMGTGGGYVPMIVKAIDEQNMCVRNETFGTLTTDGSSPKHNNRVMELYLSDKGKKYVCDPKRGMCTDINSDVCQTLTAKGQSNWTGSFVSPDIEKLEKSATIGSNEPTTIHLKNGEYITSDDDLTQYRIRKLTPLECWRLMDFTDEDFYKAEAVNSNTQLYKQAGNSIVKNVLMQIFKQMI